MRDVNSLNKVILIGHLGQNPELRYIPQTERAVANFTLATNERVFNPSTNESDIRAEWHRIVVWGKLAEFCEKYLSKGKQILLEGRLKTEKWQDRDGNQRYTTKIHAYSITLLGKRDESMTKEESYSETDQDFSEDFNDEAGPVPDDDDVPF
ncbi:MAG: single-stranded DNA-binding protein [Candidatus Aminicenantes bacterium]|nr:single-stranded DNA-binding protein [Candidatus Aminicenantes bacterium]